MSQTSYSLDRPDAVAGMLFLGDGDQEIITGIAGEDIPFGRFVALQSDGTYKLPAADADIIAGVSVFEDTLMNNYPMSGGLNTAPVIKSGTTFPILREGKIYVDYDTGSQSAALFKAPNICNDAAQTTKKGKATLAAVSTDSVRGPVFGALFYKVRTDSLALLEVDFTGIGIGASIPWAAVKKLPTAVTGSLSTVAAADVKAVLTSLINQLVTAGLITNGTT